MSQIAEAQAEADRQRDALRRLTTRLTLDRGLSLLEGDNRRAGLLWLARSLKSASGQNDPFEPAIRANLAAWSPLVHRLRDCLEHRGPVRVVAWSPTGRSIATGSDDGIVRHLGSGFELDRESWPITLKHDGRGASPGFHAGRQDPGDRRRRPDRPAVERGLGPAAGRAHAPPRPGGFRRVQPGRQHARHRQRRRHWSGSGTLRPASRAASRSSTASRSKSVVIAPDGKSIASLDEPGGVVIWDVPTAEPRVKSTRATRRDRSHRVQPRLDQAGLRRARGPVVSCLTLPMAARSAASPKGVQGERIQALAFSHDGTRIAIGSYDTTCSICTGARPGFA